MKPTLKLGSLFDGSGGFPLAGVLSGIEPVWASEIEPYPIAVTRSRFPNMKHLGDITKVNGADIEPVDVVTWGSPCQSLSVAGKRDGIRHKEHGDDETTKSGLFYEAIRVIREMREKTNGEYPKFGIFENVDGIRSCSNGEDFRTVLEELTKVCGGGRYLPIPRPSNGRWTAAGEIVGDTFSIAWRMLDAQYWGCAQRRRRIYLVTDFRGGGAGKILFELNGCDWNTQAGKEERQGTSEDAHGGIGRSCDVGRWRGSRRQLVMTAKGPDALIYDCRGNGDGQTANT